MWRSKVKGAPWCSDKESLPFPEMRKFALRARSELQGCISDVTGDPCQVYGWVRLVKGGDLQGGAPAWGGGGGV